jgi:hypothetical protein
MDKKAKEHQARRFTADKMQSVQLITNKSYIEHSRHQQFAFVVQYNSEGIISMTLADP